MIYAWWETCWPCLQSCSTWGFLLWQQRLYLHHCSFLSRGQRSGPHHSRYWTPSSWEHRLGSGWAHGWCRWKRMCLFNPCPPQENDLLLPGWSQGPCKLRGQYGHIQSSNYRWYPLRRRGADLIMIWRGSRSQGSMAFVRRKDHLSCWYHNCCCHRCL